MKLRLRENSIRLRLLQSEVKILKATGTISEQIRFSESQSLIYTIKISEETDLILADFIDNEIIVKVPLIAAHDWFETNLVGLENAQEISGEKSLKILIEKDFVCLDRPFDKDNADAFPHPQMKC